MPPLSVTLTAGTIRYSESGAGEPLLFLHGYVMNGASWRKVVPLLEGRYRCIVPDWPLGAHTLPMNAGADLSPPALAALVPAFLDALGLGRVTLVGNDMGGAISQLVAAGHPERVERLVLAPCDAFDNFPPPAFKYLQWVPRVPGLAFVLAQLMRIRAMRRLPITYGWLAKKPLDAAVLESYVRPPIRDPGVRRDAARAMAGASSRYLEEALPALARFDRPVLLAWATEDRFFPFAHAERLSRHFPNAVLRPIADAYTLVGEDQPEQLAAAIDELCRSTPARDAAAVGP